jgi:fumarate hydratase class I
LHALIKSGNKLPENIDFKGKFIYYVGPVDAIKDEIVGPAGPTTATRMDPYTETMLGLGLLGMIGKAERGDATIASLAQHQATYLIAVGGAAYLVSQAIRKARVLAFAELGMEAIYEMEVKDMPVTVAVSTRGESIHQSGPQQWARLAMPIKTDA